MSADINSSRLGFFGLREMIVEVIERDGRLLVAWPGLPAGFEVKLNPTDQADSFQVVGGPVNGALIQFTPGETAEEDSYSVAGMSLTRCPKPTKEQYENARHHIAPPLPTDPDREAAFATLWSEIQASPAGHEIDYNLPYPKHQFFRYLEALETLIFHGSGNFDIEEFRPLRSSIELNDTTGRGNKVAIYGTHDALWPLFFAVIDRPNLDGSIRNGVNYFENDEGNQLAAYHFSINQLQLADRPFRTGMLYILPRKTFLRLEHAPGILTNEWASEESVMPIAKIKIEPEDFPFLEQIVGHDDSALIEGARLTRIVLANVTTARLEAEALIMELDWSAEMAQTILPFVAAQRAVLPTASFSLDFPAGQAAVTLTFTGPAAYLAVIKQRLGDKVV